MTRGNSLGQKKSKVITALELFRSLTEQEQRHFFGQLIGERNPILWIFLDIAFDSKKSEKRARELAFKTIFDFASKYGGMIKTPQNRDRNIEIISLREEKQLSFGQIAKLKSMTPKAVEKAYHREKARRTPPIN